MALSDLVSEYGRCMNCEKNKKGVSLYLVSVDANLTFNVVWVCDACAKLIAKRSSVWKINDLEEVKTGDNKCRQIPL